MSNLDLECQIIEIYLKYLLGLAVYCEVTSHKANAEVAAGVCVLVRSLTVLMSGVFPLPTLDALLSLSVTVASL